MAVTAYSPVTTCSPLRLLYQLLSDHSVGLSAVRGALHDVSAGVLYSCAPVVSCGPCGCGGCGGCLRFMWFVWFMWIVRGRMRHMRDDRSAVGGLSLGAQPERPCAAPSPTYSTSGSTRNGAASADAHAGAARYITRRFRPRRRRASILQLAGAGHEHAQPGPAERC